MKILHLIGFYLRSEVFKSPYYDEYNKLYRYYFQKPVLENNYIYNLLLVDGRSQEGDYLEKIDCETGEKIWFNYFDLTTSDRQEAPVLMRINSGESVEIVSQRLNVPFSTENDLYNSGVDMSVVYRKYSDVDGKLMEELIPEASDTLALRTQFSAFVRGNRVSYFFLKKMEISGT
ncbi:MAG: hypothetical protein IPH36_15530 [Saprospiraceae bacterium]|nr:hypothetical protein [Saprospiraceae bacterium]